VIGDKVVFSKYTQAQVAVLQLFAADSAVEDVVDLVSYGSVACVENYVTLVVNVDGINLIGKCSVGIPTCKLIVSLSIGSRKYKTGGLGVKGSGSKVKLFTAVKVNDLIIGSGGGITAVIEAFVALIALAVVILVNVRAGIGELFPPGKKLVAVDDTQNQLGNGPGDSQDIADQGPMGGEGQQLNHHTGNIQYEMKNEDVGQVIEKMA
jgi:hypothetical protein